MDTHFETSTDRIGDRLVYTVAEAGALLGISLAFAYELDARGELPSSGSAGDASCPRSPCSPSSRRTGPAPPSESLIWPLDAAAVWTSTSTSTPLVRAWRPLCGLRSLRSIGRAPSRPAKPRRPTCRAPGLDGSGRVRSTEWTWTARPGRPGCASSRSRRGRQPPGKEYQVVRRGGFGTLVQVSVLNSVLGLGTLGLSKRSSRERGRREKPVSKPHVWIECRGRLARGTKEGEHHRLAVRVQPIAG